MENRQRFVPPYGVGGEGPADYLPQGFCRPLDSFVFAGGAQSSDYKTISVSTPSLVKFGTLRNGLVLGPVAVAALSGWNLQIDARGGSTPANNSSTAFEDRGVLQANRGLLYLPYAGRWSITCTLTAANVAGGAMIGGMIYEGVSPDMYSAMVDAPPSRLKSGVSILAAGQAEIITAEVGLRSAVLASSAAGAFYYWSNPLSNSPTFTIPTSGTNTGVAYIPSNFFGANSFVLYNPTAGALSISYSLTFD